MNSFGNIFRFTSFGESHGAAVGGVIDGCPAGITIDYNLIQHQLDRRAGRIDNDLFTSSRAVSEHDQIEWLSGIYQGKSLGTPISFIIRNTNARSQDYSEIEHIFRPGHADFTYQTKYGIHDPRGGGRASARETVARVVAGSIAMQILRQQGISIKARIVQIGNNTQPEQWHDYVAQIARQGDSIGGIVRCDINGLHAGIGEPIFDKLQARLAYAILSINACKGFDYGTGFEGAGLKGSESNQKSGGILGGISDGKEISFRAVFKPAPSISLPQQTIDDKGNRTEICIKGRHDVCFLPRVLPVVESMAALTIADLIMFNKK